jgi:myo-inositol-1(or 4)-monophosphatase
MRDIDQKLKAELIATAHALADAARPVTLKYFRTRSLSADNKLSDGFDPVTEADRQSELIMRETLSKLRPDDGIIGEEFGANEGSSGFTWVLDPIDGTRGYISGTPTWGVLIAVNAGAAPLFGVIDQPYVQERFAGGFGVAELDGPHGQTALATRSVKSLSEAVIFTTFPEVGTTIEGLAFHDLARQTKLTRYGMDCYAYALLALGQIDLVVEAGLSSYDIQAPIAVVEAAGGTITNWQGGPAHDGGRVIAAGSKKLHEIALEILVKSTH